MSPASRFDEFRAHVPFGSRQRKGNKISIARSKLLGHGDAATPLSGGANRRGAECTHASRSVHSACSCGHRIDAAARACTLLFPHETVPRKELAPLRQLFVPLFNQVRQVSAEINTNSRLNEPSPTQFGLIRVKARKYYKFWV